MTRGKRIGVFGVCVLMAAGLFVPQFMGATMPTTAPAAAPRSADAIYKDLQTTDAQIHALLPSPALLADEAYRKGDGQKLMAPLRQMAGLFAEMAAATDKAEARQAFVDDQFTVLSFAAVLGDADAQKSLAAAAGAKGDDDARAVSAQAALEMVKWLSSGRDAAAQGKVLDETEALAKAHPDSIAVAQSLGFMSNVGGADATLSKRAVSIARANLKGDTVDEVLPADQKELIGKPLVLEGRTSTGGKFTSADYKGKVILVDFWATWCGPCIAGLPEVKQVYKDYHAKGLEIVGVSCDSTDDKLNSFTQENGMTWVQLREESQNGADEWHPLAKKYGVMGIPTMFLIDKQGVLRFVDARAHLEDGVKQLLAEADKPAAAPAAAGAATQPAVK